MGAACMINGCYLCVGGVSWLPSAIDVWVEFS